MTLAFRPLLLVSIIALTASATYSGWRFGAEVVSNYLEYVDARTQLAKRDSALPLASAGDYQFAVASPFAHSTMARRMVRLGDVAAAAEQYERALSVRPTWPYDWIGLAVILPPDSGEQFGQYTRLALKYGPAERGVYESIVRYGLKHWYELPELTKMAFQESIDALLAMDHRALFRIPVRDHKVRRFCRVAGSRHRVRLWCSKQK